jgi:aspartyl-tRNA(Asn)/glutamyl-tRNA(Gln) amidotransferase subunit B
VLTSTRAQADYFERVAEICGDPKLAANWVMVELGAVLNKQGRDIGSSPVSAEALGQLLARIHDGSISGKIAKDVFAAMLAGEGDADQIIAARGLKQITDSGALQAIVDEVIAANPQQVDNYRAADEKKRPKMIGFFVGQIMKKTQGKANPKQVNDLLRAKLEG